MSINNLSPVHFHQVGLNPADGNAPDIEGQNLAIVARPTDLILIDKRVRTRPDGHGDFNEEFAAPALESLAALAVPDMAKGLRRERAWNG